MWLIDTRTLSLKSFIGKPPPYVILSHTWLPNNAEVTFADFCDDDRTIRERKAGYQKIRLTCEQAKAEGIRYAWVDTCCINKESSAELSEAINSMFKWYGSATTCYAYLEDSLFEHSLHVSTNGRSTLQGCKWFSRGWTLQELIAPRDVVFFAPRREEWVEIGRKQSLCQSLEQITRIPREMLLQQKPLKDFTVAARMSWAASRRTTREEDIAYCLLGLFDVNMPLLYSEGTKAFIRLQEEILRSERDDSLFAWCSTEASAVKFPYRGLFASSPREFAGSSDIMKSQLTEADADATTSMIGNGRVSLSCGVIDKSDGASQVLTLNCYRRSASNTLGIIGTRIGFNTYLRSEPSRLASSPPGSLQNITIEKHVLKKTGVAVENLVSGDDEIVLSDMPRSFQIQDVYFGRGIGQFTSMPMRFWTELTRSWRFLKQFTPAHKEQNSNTRTVPVSKVVGGKVAFDISFSESIQWLASKNTTSSGRFLLILWIDPIPGSESWRFHLDAKYVSSDGAEACFETAERPSQFKGRFALVFGDVIVSITSCRRVEGRSRAICPRLTISPRQVCRHEANARSQRRDLREKKLYLFNYLFVWAVPGLVYGLCGYSSALDAASIIGFASVASLLMAAIILLVLIHRMAAEYRETKMARDSYTHLSIRQREALSERKTEDHLRWYHLAKRPQNLR